jgi:serine/threonine-protein kinase
MLSRVELGRARVLAGRYALEGRLGRGGMGEVWRAKRLDDGLEVAVKLLREDLARDESAKKRFVREARAAAAVTHPNVVALYDVHESDETPFLVMELLHGETLGERLRRKGALGVAETAAVLLPVFDAVEAAHAAGVVHRDLKPDNVYLARDGADAERVSVRVLDFGIAKRIEKLATPMGETLGATTQSAATTGAMLGTPYYMAPEQALGERDVDARADLWSLGVMLYECLAGRRPTEAATLGGVLKILVTGAIEPLGSAVPELDPELADEVMDLLRADREERATSLTALRTSLGASLPSTFVLELPPPSSARGLSVDTEPGSSSPVLPQAASQTVSGARWSRGRFVAPVGFALLVLASGALALRMSAPSSRVVLAPSSGAEPAVSVASSASSVLPLQPSPSAKVALSASTEVAPPSPPPASVASSHSGRAKVVAPPAASTKPSAVPTTSSASPRGPSGLVTDNPFGH